MGYTNYWTPKKSITKKNRVKMVEFVRKTIELSGVSICGYDGTGKPMISQKLISLNGEDEDSHESFAIMGTDDDWNFCKTARKPYDVVIKSCLIYATEIGIMEKWSFDGKRGDKELLEGENLYKLTKKSLEGLSIEEMKQKLVLDEFEKIDDGTMIDILLEGCTGWNHFDDDYIKEQYEEVFG